ncbi:unnamed protein product [Kuraishia capsulata CBS 1993]|uniref:FAD-binding domain-containing protein n=1 Tax=Kuraishia capsulata CBS 1993 TaxID=1382522 RepID=W6MWY8_9ASCO|nr:uncharacterized protein KUCA_T00003990001 [Kuraishia capsulata CBS 1993]CDK28010.1 unnamed protein product [Kuraishia capsulata CBS 1993]
MSSGEPLIIAVIGGGVAGLTLALAAHQRGVRVDVFERNAEITEVGAGLALGANAVRIIESLGIKDEFRAISSLSTNQVQNIYRRYNTSEEYHRGLYSNPDDHSAYHHRADFVKLLASAIPSDQIHLNKKFKSANQSQDKVTVAFEDGSEFEADILVGADGIHSKVRKYFFRDDNPVNSYQVMYREVIDIKDLKGPFENDLSQTTIWPAPGKRHVVTFPIDQGRRFAAAAIVPVSEDKKAEESWLLDGNVSDLLEILDDYHEDVKNIFRSFKKIKIYGLYDREKLDTWVDGNVLLIGDAAHPGLPHQGANAGQAIEDAYALAITLKYSEVDDDRRKNLNKWLKVFERARKDHAEGVALTSRRMGHVFNELVDNEKAVKIIKDNFRWIFNSDPSTEVQKAVFEYFGYELAFKLIE